MPANRVCAPIHRVLAPLLVLCLPWLAACGDHAIPVEAFPPPETVRLERSLGRNLFDARYLGGTLYNFTRDEVGTIYVATAEPFQVLALNESGQILWTQEGDPLPEGQFASAPEIALAGSSLIVVDPGQEAAYSTSLEGSVGAVREHLPGVWSVWGLPDGGFLAYPSLTAGFALDRYDFLLQRTGSLFRRELDHRSLNAGICSALDLPDGRIGVFWSPDRALYVLGPDGEEERVLRLDEPAIVESLERSRIRMEKALRAHPGALGVVAAFSRLERGSQGAVGVTFLFEGIASTSANEERSTGDLASLTQYFEFSLDGEPVRHVQGFGPTRDGVLPLGDGRFLTLDASENALCTFSRVSSSSRPEVGRSTDPGSAGTSAAASASSTTEKGSR